MHVSKLASGMCCGAYSVVCTRNIMLFGLIIMCADRVCFVFSLCWLMECYPRTLYIYYIYMCSRRQPVACLNSRCKDTAFPHERVSTDVANVSTNVAMYRKTLKINKIQV